MTSRRTQAWLVAALVLLAFGLRLYHLGFQSLWRDEVDAIRFATRPLSQLLQTFRQSGENGPLFFLLLRPWLALFGRSEFALRLFSVVWGTVTVPLTWHTGRRLSHFLAHSRLSSVSPRSTTATPGAAPAAARQPGPLSRPALLLATLFVATSPYLVWYSQEGKMYALVVVLALASLAALLGALTADGRSSRPRWLLYVLITSLGFYVHVLLVLLLPLHAVLFWLGWPATRPRLSGALISLGCFTLPYLPLVWWQWALLASPAFRPGFDFVPLPRLLTVLLVAFGRGMRTVPPIGFVAVWVFLLLAAVAFKWSRGRREVVGLLVWLGLPPLLLFGLTLRVPLFNDRYLIYIGPAFYMLAAAGLVAVAARSRGVALAALLLVLVLQGYGIWGQAHTPIKPDFRSAAAYVRGQRGADDIIIFAHPYNRFTFAYYAGWNYAWREAPYTNDPAQVTPALVAETLARLTQGASDVWLVAAEVSDWDGRELTRQWLAAQGTVVADGQFHLVRVTRYAIRNPGR